jgi:pilus assembly protein Flp/PilA
MIVKTAIERFIREQVAVSTIEYALLAGLIAVVILISVSAAGTQLQALFSYVQSQVTQAMS